MTTQYFFGFVDGKILEFLLNLNNNILGCRINLLVYSLIRVIIENHLNTLEASLFLPKAKSANLLIFKRNF